MSRTKSRLIRILHHGWTWQWEVLFAAVHLRLEVMTKKKSKDHKTHFPSNIFIGSPIAVFRPFPTNVNIPSLPVLLRHHIHLFSIWASAGKFKIHRSSQLHWNICPMWYIGKNRKGRRRSAVVVVGSSTRGGFRGIFPTPLRSSSSSEETDSQTHCTAYGIAVARTEQHDFFHTLFPFVLCVLVRAVGTGKIKICSPNK